MIFPESSPRYAAMVANAPQLFKELKQIVSWFEREKAKQFEAFTLHQTLETASENWETYQNEPLDLQSAIDLIRLIEGPQVNLC